MADPVFLDTNVVLDHLADRQPFAENAHRIFALGEMHQLEIHVSALTFCNLHYVLKKLEGNDRALQLLVVLNQLVNITPVGDKEIAAAMASGFKDFEDAVQSFSAMANPMVRVIITRNKGDYRLSLLSVQTPGEFLAELA